MGINPMVKQGFTPWFSQFQPVANVTVAANFDVVRRRSSVNHTGVSYKQGLRCKPNQELHWEVWHAIECTWSQILELLQSGQTNKEIGLVLGISQHTVRDYISDLFLRYSV